MPNDVSGMSPLRARLNTTLILLLALLPLLGNSLAQGSSPERTDVLLILDASGSMFNKLPDGRYRITAAKEALTDFISRLPTEAGLNVGLRVYGSSMLALEPGSCQDSLLKVPIDGLKQTALLETVRDTQARGATPIAYSLELAADDLGNSPGRKVIVLVTDGEEACGGDVRAAYQRLLDLGFELDLRIIGFDLTDRAAASFAGIGSFENATSAADLAAALGRAVAVEVQGPELVTVRATLLRDGRPAVDGVTLAFVTPQGSFGFEHQGNGVYLADVPAGGYSARIVDVNFGEMRFSALAVIATGANEFTFELVPERSVTLTVLSEATAGGKVEVAYQGAADNSRGWVSIAPVDLPDENWLDLSYTEGAAGTTVARVPRDLSQLEARFIVDLPEGGSRVIGRSVPFTAVAVDTRVDAPVSVHVGATFEVAWSGPDGMGDFITVVAVGSPEGAWTNYSNLDHGSPVTLQAPAAPGDYVVRYVSGHDGLTLASSDVAVTAATATLSGPQIVAAGEWFEVAWTGPGNDRDYITIVPAGSPPDAWLSYSYTFEEPMVVLQAPDEPGAYELRYVLESDSVEVLIAVPITVR
ncbi:MAG: VWA domain-containing protein [Trueperaceae bacterium]|nr:VWA domain-containing protein [Trueperaceae bacterium]